MQRLISIIVAADENNLIGKDNRLPWHLPADLKHFRELTMGHHILMGRKTFESIGKPLKGRTSVIITRNKDYKAEGCVVSSSLEEAIHAAGEDPEIFIVGGADIYRQSLAFCDRIYLTRVHAAFDGDAFFPPLSTEQWMVADSRQFQPDDKNPLGYSFLTYKRSVH